MKTIQGKNINLRLAEVKDAEFILGLRLQQHKTQYLSPVENDLAKQQAWLKSYKQKEQHGLEYYFIIESKHHQNLGLVRVYDLKPNSFCWGSWLIKDGAPLYASIESMLMVYEFGFSELGKNVGRIDVRNKNTGVVATHKRFGANIVEVSDTDTFFEMNYREFIESRKKFKKYINI